MPNKHSFSIPFEPELFQTALLIWYDAKRRVLPWRAEAGERPDPYRVWLSEVMLQQTTVKAVIPYFRAFLAKWASVADLAAAPRDEILAAWAGLGYYTRARNLHACAQMVAQTGFPKTEAELRKLPGIGAYTAAAIAAIAFEQPAAAVDGNVERVLSRLFAVKTPLPQARPLIRSIATELTPIGRPGDYAQAIMDLGATLCTPRAPSCESCPVGGLCAARAEGQPERFPFRTPKAARPLRQGDAFIFIRKLNGGSDILLHRRPDKGLLGGMMSLPCTGWFAGDAGASNLDAFKSMAWSNAQAVRHTFTHFQLELRVLAAFAAGGNGGAAFDGEWMPLDRLRESGLPSVMRKAIASGLKALALDPGYVSGQRGQKR